MLGCNYACAVGFVQAGKNLLRCSKILVICLLEFSSSDLRKIDIFYLRGSRGGLRYVGDLASNMTAAVSASAI